MNPASPNTSSAASPDSEPPYILNAPRRMPPPSFCSTTTPCAAYCPTSPPASSTSTTSCFHHAQYGINSVAWSRLEIEVQPLQSSPPFSPSSSSSATPSSGRATIFRLHNHYRHRASRSALGRRHTQAALNLSGQLQYFLGGLLFADLFLTLFIQWKHDWRWDLVSLIVLARQLPPHRRRDWSLDFLFSQIESSTSPPSAESKTSTPSSATPGLADHRRHVLHGIYLWHPLVYRRREPHLGSASPSCSLTTTLSSFAVQSILKLTSCRHRLPALLQRRIRRAPLHGPCLAAKSLLNAASK